MGKELRRKKILKNENEMDFKYVFFFFESKKKYL